MRTSDGGIASNLPSFEQKKKLPWVGERYLALLLQSVTRTMPKYSPKVWFSPDQLDVHAEYEGGCEKVRRSGI